MRLTHVLLCATVALTATSAQSAVQPYSFTDLGTGSFAAAINDSGQVVGNIGGDAALWNGTTLTDLGAGEARDINNAGLIVGNSNGQATIWNGTTPTYIGSFLAIAINNPGQVIGQNFNGGMGTGINVILWNGVSASFVEPEGTSLMHPYSMNDVGQVSGYGRTVATGPDQARVVNLSDATAIRLNSSPGAFYPDSNGYDINNLGQVVGVSHFTPHIAISDLHATLWDGTTTPTDLGSLGGVSLAYAINDRGQIVGYSENANGIASIATLWSDGTIFDLNSFLDASTVAAGWILTSANDINEQGWIIGNAFNTITGTSSAFVLSPAAAIPEPEIYAMLATGLGLLGWKARRKRN